MNDVFCPFKSHEFKNFLELLEMQVLLGSNDINILIKIISVFSVFCTCDVTGDIQR